MSRIFGSRMMNSLAVETWIRLISVVSIAFLSFSLLFSSYCDEREEFPLSDKVPRVLPGKTVFALPSLSLMSL